MCKTEKTLGLFLTVANRKILVFMPTYLVIPKVTGCEIVFYTTETSFQWVITLLNEVFRGAKCSGSFRRGVHRGNSLRN
jgi:hypothetical protein